MRLPARRAPVAGGVGAPPELPPALLSPLELTLELEAHGKGSPDGAVLRTVTRTADRVHVALSGGRLEWLFVRNPLDVRRVSAWLVDHRQHTILAHDESELARSGIARGWSDVAGLGFELDALERGHPTGRRERRFGFEFVELAKGPGERLWWSERASLPLGGARVQPSPAIQLRAVRVGVDRALLREPRQRFADYAVLDVTDYRERHEH